MFLWKSLRAEISSVVEDFREKGAVGALRDVALDAKDIVTDTGSALLSGAQALAPKAREGPQIRRSTGDALPEVGSEVQLELPDGSLDDAVVLAVDTISVPPRARVRRLRDDEA
mmetsp:Transcript_77913/g.172667  ORF Transcript_77913/g.172667 Transcript_77913/m.172667 type:complete len:114 (-) Transcript_77913:133-474(-)